MHAGPTYESTITTTYDAGDRPTQIADSLSGKTITREYDGLNRLTCETTATPPQCTVSYTYAGNGKTMTVAGQPAVGYAYDLADRLTQVARGASTGIFSRPAENARFLLLNLLSRAYSMP